MKTINNKKIKMVKVMHSAITYNQGKWLIENGEMYKWRIDEDSTLTKEQAISDEANCFFENYDSDHEWFIPEYLLTTYPYYL